MILYEFVVVSPLMFTSHDATSQPSCHITSLAMIVCTSCVVANMGCSRAPSHRDCLPGIGIEQGRACAQISRRRIPFKLPFRAGYTTTINQAYHDNPTHKDQESYAIDFSCEPGDPIVAARDGIIWEVRKDSFEQCTDKSCMGEDNYVIIDHGDGTRSGYHHLAPMGATVKPGDSICQGQLIGVCGNTGYSTGPHLHWQLNALWDHSLPARFDEFAQKTGHLYPIYETSYTSDNARQTSCPRVDYSSLPRDAFSHRGIVLDEPFPTHHSGKEPLRLRGVYLGDQPNVAVHIRARHSETWTTLCTSRDEDGHFVLTHKWSELRELSHDYWMMVTGVGEECKNTRWAWAYAVKVGAKPEPLKREDIEINPDQLRRDEPRGPQ